MEEIIEIPKPKEEKKLESLLEKFKSEEEDFDSDEDYFEQLEKQVD